MATLTLAERCDLAVVGAGIVGTMMAHLAAAQHPAWNVVLADRGLAGRGATGYSLALDVGYGANSAMHRLVAMSAPAYRDLAAAMPVHFRALATLAVVDGSDSQAWLNRFSTSEARLADAADLTGLRTRWPSLVISPGDAVIAGVRATRAAPGALVESLVTSLRRRGVRCWEGTEVETFDSTTEGVRLSMADGRKLLAARVVVAVGPWVATGPWQPFAHRLGVRVKKVVAMHLDIRPNAGDPLVLLMADDAFLLPDFGSERYLFSFASSEWDCLPDPARLRITPDDRETALAILGRRLPGLAERCAGGQVFCDAYARDRIPLVAGLEADPRVLFATGGSGSGFRLAPGIALAALERLGAVDRQVEAASVVR